MAEAKLMQEQGSADARIAEMHKELATMQYHVSMNEDKVRPVLKTHKLKTLKLVVNTLDKGWKTWSVQATELQLLRADRDNRSKQGPWFFKMSKEAITAIQEDLARDLYELASNHREEITCLIEEFDAHDIDTSVKLDKYERNWRQQTNELGYPSMT